MAGSGFLILFFFSLPFLLLLLLIVMVCRRKKRQAVFFKDNPLLPLWDTAGQSYALAWKYRAEFFRIAWGWMAIGLPLLFLFNATMGTPIFCMDMAELKGREDMHTGSDFLISSLPDLLTLLVGVSVAVAWHRLVLRGEKVTLKPYLRFDGVVRGYLLVVLCLWLAANLPSFIVNMAFSRIDPMHGNNTALFIVGLFSVVLGLITAYGAVRLTVMLPARALGLKGITVKEVLRRTRYNFWRISWGHFLCVFPAGILFMLLLFPLQSWCRDRLATAFLYTVQYALMVVVFAPVYLSFLSLSYRHFFEKGGQGSRGTDVLP